MAWLGPARHGEVTLPPYSLTAVWRISSGHGTASPGMAGSGVARRGCRTSVETLACGLVYDWRGKARRGKARRGVVFMQRKRSELNKTWGDA